MFLPWLLTSSLPLPAEAFLTSAEQGRFDSLKTAKRKHDWLLGRWTAKNLFAAYMRETVGEVPLHAIEIRNAPSGAPYGLWNGHELPPLTISHGHGYAFCVICPAPVCHYPHVSTAAEEGDGRSPIAPRQELTRQERLETPLPQRGRGRGLGLPQVLSNSPHGRMGIGADLEKIESRIPLFVADYFTPYEQAQVAATAPAWRDTLITAIWSAKEAALKVVQLGLTVDTRGVECRLPPILTKCNPNAWAEFAIDWHPRHLPQPFPPLMGWWRVWKNLVLTIALLERAADHTQLF